jgi:hypothetical protein
LWPFLHRSDAKGAENLSFFPSLALNPLRLPRFLESYEAYAKSIRVAWLCRGCLSDDNKRAGVAQKARSTKGEAK